MTASGTHTRAIAQRRHTGFTLVEALMSVVIVSGVLVSALGTLGAIGRARQVQIDRAAAMRLGDELLAEVLQSYYQDPSGGGTTIGPDAGESTRAQFDDVDDYNGWQESPPTSRGGTALPEYTRWKRKVRVDYAGLDDPKALGTSLTGLKRIRITVTTATDAAYEVTAMRSSNGAYEQVPGTSTTYLTWAGVTVKVGPNGKTIYGGAHPLNGTSSQ